MDVDAVVAAYWQFYERFSSDDRAARLSADDLEWAASAARDVVERGGDGAITLIDALAETAPDETALAYLGAGLVEELLCRHGREVLDSVDVLARRSARFRTALRCAWFDTHLDTDAAAQLRRFGYPL